MSDPAPEVKAAADSAITETVAPEHLETPSAAADPQPAAPVTTAAPEAAAPAPEAVAAQQPPTPVQQQQQQQQQGAPKTLPAYALQYAPILWLQKEEQYWPSNPLEHLENCIPQGKDGSKIDFPHDLIGKHEILKLAQVDHPEVYLVLNKSDPRVNARIESLMATKGRPDPHTHKSDSTCWVIAVDKTKQVGEGILDVFYFYFYPYNLGNTVAFTEFGNHVGDWEHSMVRFHNGKPIALHLSAHSDGHSWAWKTVEKMGERPVGYVASGSHAMYGKPGEKSYSPVPLVGPKDYTSRGILWDPILRYCAATYDIDSQTFTYLPGPSPTPTFTAPAPAPGATPGAQSSQTQTITPEYDPKLTPDEIVTVLTYKGRWGNSFSDIRNPKEGLHDKFKDMLHLGGGHGHGNQRKDPHSLGQKLSMLKWAEGPSGPRWKSLERVGVTWNTTDLLPELV